LVKDAVFIFEVKEGTIWISTVYVRMVGRPSYDDGTNFTIPQNKIHYRIENTDKCPCPEQDQIET
jgi:hypothetical protein